jgi:hypothetical protein
MTSVMDNEGGFRYRSRGGIVAFGLWCLVVFAGVALPHGMRRPGANHRGSS